jgi:hypothetical protein
MSGTSEPAPPPAEDIMPDPLPAYSGTMSICPKCGLADARTSYLETGFCVHSDEGNTLVRNELGTGVPRMHRECRCCGYMWDEAPLNPEPTYATQRETQASVAA